MTPAYDHQIADHDGNSWIDVRATGRSQDTENLPTPGFHHLHLNSTNPDAAIDFFVKNFQSTSRSTWGGTPALKAGKAYILFATR
jgi:hypothetical protein